MSRCPPHPLLKEAKVFGKGKLANNIEIEELQAFAQITSLFRTSESFIQPREENSYRGVNERLKLYQC
jgi:hypothetical protein